MRIGVFGGTFDPPHIGHVLAAVDACEALALDKLIIVPAASQPLKSDSPALAAPRDRLEMVKRAMGEDKRLEVSAMEIERGGLSYTVDTLETLARENPGAELVLIVGMDTLGTIDKWKNPDRIFQLAKLAVLARSSDRGLAASGEVSVFMTRRIDVSSSEIRQRIAEGKSIHGYVAESVETYIASANLYRSARQPVENPSH
ncbi:MAG: nicotinate-nucleotide adenylyltransferase [Gemmatimonadaceae bacterium]